MKEKEWKHGFDADKPKPLELRMLDGMTLRDYFAAYAMEKLIAGDRYGVFDAKCIAVNAYEVADAMLIARERKEEKR